MIGLSWRTGRSKIKWVANEEKNLEDFGFFVYIKSNTAPKTSPFCYILWCISSQSQKWKSEFWRCKRLTGCRNIIYHKENESQRSTMDVLGTRLQTTELNLIPFTTLSKERLRNFVGWFSTESGFIERKRVKCYRMLLSHNLGAIVSYAEIVKGPRVLRWRHNSNKVICFHNWVWICLDFVMQTCRKTFDKVPDQDFCHRIP